MVLDQRLFVGLRGYPEDHDVPVALAGLGVDSIGTGTAKEHERLSTDLVDGFVAGCELEGDVRHARSQLVHVLDACPSVHVCHLSSLGIAPVTYRNHAGWRSAAGPPDGDWADGGLGRRQPDASRERPAGHLAGRAGEQCQVVRPILSECETTRQQSAR